MNTVEVNKNKICLVMIVKNEAKVLPRCFDSVLPIIDGIYISDTGSTDDTVDIIIDYFKDIDMLAISSCDEWVDFATNRTLALNKARLAFKDEFNYFLMIDADETLIFDDLFNPFTFKETLTADVYDVMTDYGSLHYVRPQLFKSSLPCHFKGVLHEYLNIDTANFTRDTIEGIRNLPNPDGARSNNPNKFKEDAEVLLNAFQTETDDFLKVRYAFYLAQSYRDANCHLEAIHWYRTRAAMGGWSEEIYISLLNIARLKDQLLPDTDKMGAVDDYLKAYEVSPHRAEALYGAVKCLRLSTRNNLAYLLAKQAYQLIPPENGLFVERWIYDYAIADELSIVAYWSGHYQEAFKIGLELISLEKYPTTYKSRLIENLQFAADKLDGINYQLIIDSLRQESQQ